MTGAFDGEVGKAKVTLEATTDPAQAAAEIEKLDREVQARLDASGKQGGRIWSTGMADEMGKGLGIDKSGNDLKKSGSFLDRMWRGFTNFFRGRGKVTRQNVVDMGAEDAGGFFADIFSSGFAKKLGGFLQALRIGPTVSQAFSGIWNAIPTTGPGAFFSSLAGAPMIAMWAALIPLILAAVEGLQAFVSLLYLIPSLLFSIGLMGASLFLVFHGLMTTIAGVIAAQNVDQLNAALVGVNNNAAAFLRQLYDVKVFLGQISNAAKDAFFGAIGPTALTDMFKSIGPTFAYAIEAVSAGLGSVVKNLLLVFSSPKFAQMLMVLGYQASNWLQNFGPSLGKFLDGLNNLAVSLAPFLNWFGAEVNKVFTKLGDWFTKLSQDPKFLAWIEQAKVLMPEFIKLLGDVGTLIMTIVDAFLQSDKPNGPKDFLSTIDGFVKGLTQIVQLVMQNPDVFRFIIDMAEGSIIMVISLIAIILIVIDDLVIAINWLITAGIAIGDFFSSVWDGIKKIGTKIGDAIYGITHAGQDMKDKLSAQFSGVADLVGQSFKGITDFFKDPVGSIQRLFDTIKTDFMTALTKLGDDAYNGGKHWGERLMAGIKDSLPALLQAAIDGLKALSDHLPHSPAKTGPLSGRGDPLYAGRELINRLATGIEDATPTLTGAVSSAVSTIHFNKGSIQVNYAGPMPNSGQMQAMGAAAGRGIVGQITSAQLVPRIL